MRGQFNRPHADQYQTERQKEVVRIYCHACSSVGYAAFDVLARGLLACAVGSVTFFRV